MASMFGNIEDLLKKPVIIKTAQSDVGKFDPGVQRVKSHRVVREKPRIDPIPMTYEELLPMLIENKLVTPIQSKPKECHFSADDNINATCSYHVGSSGHTIENCGALKRKVQSLIDSGAWTFDP